MPHIIFLCETKLAMSEMQTQVFMFGFDNCLVVDHHGCQVVYLCSGSERLMFLCIPIIFTILMPLFG